MIYLIAAFFGIYFIFHIVLFIGVSRIPFSKRINKEFPFISILLSCRNEEKDINRCLKSLENMDYPKDRLQVIMIDDFSTDSTSTILRDAEKRNANFEFYQSSDFPSNHLEAKARGIEHAASKANGEWLFITDADCELPSTWLLHMLDGVDKNTGIITGAMDTLNTHFIGTLERLATLGKLVFAYGIAGFGVSVFALGPNMAIRKSVYDEAGGLKKADFRIAEDIALFKLSHDLGYKTKYHFDHFTSVKSTPVSTFKQLNSQQIRWMKGGFEGKSSHAIEAIILFISLIFLSAFLGIGYLFFVNSTLATLLILLKSTTEAILLTIYWKRLKAKRLFRLLPIVAIYSLFIAIWLPFATFIKKKTEWMGEGYVVRYN